MLRTLAIAFCLGLATFAQGATVPSCERLDAENRGRDLRLGDAGVGFEGETLVLRAGGSELIRIDAARTLKVAGRTVEVPQGSRADLDAYVAGFRRLTDDAEAIGVEGGRLAGRAVTGLVSVLFTSATIADYERRIEAEAARIEARADALCRTIAELQRTERALQQRIPAFPTYLAPAPTAL